MSIQFKKPTLIEQTEKIKSELKDKPYIEKITKAGVTLDVSPIYTETTSCTELNPTLSSKLNVKQYNINSTLEKDINKLIINDLNMGVNSLVLDFNFQKITSNNLATLFNDVRLDYIHTIFYNIEKDSIDTLVNYLASLPYEVPAEQIALDNNGQSDSNFSKIHTIGDASFFTDSSRLLNQLETDKHRNNYILLEGSQDYFWDIAKVRALKTLAVNLLTKSNIDKNIVWLVQSKNLENTNNEKNLIKHTMTALSALSATADGVWVEPYSSNKDYASRISLHIFNILNEESHINLVNDVSKGSYYIENYTLEVAKNIYKHYNPS